MGAANVIMKHTVCAEHVWCCRKGIVSGSAECGLETQVCYLVI